MATVFTHAAAAVAIGALFSPWTVPRRLWIVGAIGAMLPDADVVGFAFGVDYDSFWGHRGFTHSLAFAAIAAIGFTAARLRWMPSPLLIALYLFLAIASHGLLDACTDGGLGVAFLSPFDDRRFFFPLRPIAVSRIGLGFFSGGAGRVIVSELVWIWIPSLILFAAGLRLHREPAAIPPSAARDRRGG